MREPVRNLIVYGDGRIEEVPFRLAGRYYVQTEDLGDGRMRERTFESDYARGGPSEEVDNPELRNDAPYTMVYLERTPLDSSSPPPPMVDEVRTVNGTPVKADAPLSTRKCASTIHKECVRSGGHDAERGGRDLCSRCGLSGYVIRAETYRAMSEEAERKSNAGLRDQLVALRDENTKLKVENCDLRRTVERVRRTPHAKEKP